MTANITWDQWWKIFDELDDQRKYETMQYNFKGLTNWTSFIRQQTPKGQIEVLGMAPRALVKELRAALYPEVRVKLLGEQPIKRRYRR